MALGATVIEGSRPSISNLGQAIQSYSSRQVFTLLEWEQGDTYNSLLTPKKETGHIQDWSQRYPMNCSSVYTVFLQRQHKLSVDDLPPEVTGKTKAP